MREDMGVPILVGTPCPAHTNNPSAQEGKTDPAGVPSMKTDLSRRRRALRGHFDDNQLDEEKNR